jgi:hypothetical protein
MVPEGSLSEASSRPVSVGCLGSDRLILSSDSISYLFVHKDNYLLSQFWGLVSQHIEQLLPPELPSSEVVLDILRLEIVRSITYNL